MIKFEFDMEPCTLWSLIIVGGVALLYMFWDVNYFIRVFLTIGWAKLRQKKVKLNESGVIYGFCTTNDVDIFLRHMNNARYVRELDFARFYFYETTGLYREIVKAKGTALQSASFIRYRRTIPIFTAYKVTTKLIYWDDKALYLEQQFVTIQDGFVRATVISKQNVVGMDVNQVLVKMNQTKPPMPEELKHLCECIDISSARLRKKD